MLLVTITDIVLTVSSAATMIFNTIGSCSLLLPFFSCEIVYFFCLIIFFVFTPVFMKVVRNKVENSTFFLHFNNHNKCFSRNIEDLNQ